MFKSKKSDKNKKKRTKNYLTESYNSREYNQRREAERERNLQKERERDKRRYRDNRNSYYDEVMPSENMTHEEIRARRKYEQRRQRRKTSIFEKLVIIITVIAISYFAVVTIKETEIKQISECDVKSGTLEKVVQGKAKIIRDEKVIYSKSEGDVEYYYHEGEKVKNGVNLAKIYAKTSSKELEEEISELDEAIVKMQNKTMSDATKQELANVDVYIYGLIDEYLVYSNTDYAFDVYDLKSELESKFAIKRDIYLNSSSISSNKYQTDRDLLNKTLDYNAKYVKAPRGGIVSYYVDGYEENYTPANIKNLKGKYLQEGNTKLISGNKKTHVKAKEPICKVVDNTAWYITATLDKEETKKWTINDKKVLRIKSVGDGKITGTIVNVLEYNKNNIVTFKISEQMNKYMAFRDIEVEVIETEITGIKIPNTAIETRECVKLPKSCVVNKNSNYFVIKSENGAEKEVLIKIAYIGTDNYYVLASDGTVKKGEYVVVKEEVPNEDGTSKTVKKQLAVGENIMLSGVYKVAGTIYKYVIVNVLTSNETHTIIEDSETSNVILYDKIIVDATTIKGKKNVKHQ